MNSLELKIPPVAVFLVCGAAMWFVSMLFPSLSIHVPGGKAVAVVAAGAGIAFGVAGVLAFRAASTTVDPRYPEKSSMVVRTGVYGRSRNPMYLGLLLILSGWALFLAHALALVGLPIFVVYLNRFQIQPEERAMLSGFGSDYRDYRESVRRWI
jgi:protein-S-isoprenylcysteine O-methyltransferase Ste14